MTAFNEFRAGNVYEYLASSLFEDRLREEVVLFQRRTAVDQSMAWDAVTDVFVGLLAATARKSPHPLEKIDRLSLDHWWGLVRLFAKRKLIDRSRTERRRNERVRQVPFEELEAMLADPQPQPEERIMLEEWKGEARSLLATLPPELARLVKPELIGLSTPELAKRLNTSHRQVLNLRGRLKTWFRRWRREKP